jgi:hypothetical protein
MKRESFKKEVITMTVFATEEELVQEFRNATKKRDELRRSLEVAESEYNELEARLVELLEDKGTTSTARYAGLGHVTLIKPRLFTSVLVDNKEKLFAYLRSIKRDDLIKTDVNANSLPGLIGELILAGKPVPEFVFWDFKSHARFYEAKK